VLVGYRHYRHSVIPKHVTHSDDGDDGISKFLLTDLAEPMVRIGLGLPTFPTHTRVRHGVLVSRHGVLHV